MNTETKVEKTSLIVTAFNRFQVLGWSMLIFNIFSYLYAHLYNLDVDKLYLNIALNILKIMQTLQVCEIIFSLVGITKGSAVFSSFQIFGRLIVTWVFFNENAIPWNIFLVLIPWSVADIIRSLFYLKKDDKFIGMLRYNLFIILYPAGVLGEILLAQSRLDQGDFREYTLLVRVFQIVVVFGLVFLYTYLIKQRSKFYKEIKEQQKIK